MAPAPSNLLIEKFTADGSFLHLSERTGGQLWLMAGPSMRESRGSQLEVDEAVEVALTILRRVTSRFGGDAVMKAHTARTLDYLDQQITQALA